MNATLYKKVSSMKDEIVNLLDGWPYEICDPEVRRRIRELRRRIKKIEQKIVRKRC